MEIIKEKTADVDTSRIVINTINDKLNKTEISTTPRGRGATTDLA